MAVIRDMSKNAAPSLTESFFLQNTHGKLSIPSILRVEHREKPGQQQGTMGAWDYGKNANISIDLTQFELRTRDRILEYYSVSR
jgi:hypothetical protein